MAVPDPNYWSGREQLLRWRRRRSALNGLARQADIVLRCADGFGNRDVAAQVQLSAATVGKRRQRYISRGRASLLDEPRRGAPRRITDEQVEQVVVRTLEIKPTNATHWTARRIAEAVGLSDPRVLRNWHEFGLQPHRHETFKLPNDPQPVEKARDLVGLYLHPPETALVRRVDHKSQIQSLDRTRPLLPMRPGIAERQTHDYHRPGTTTLFAALKIGSGKVIGDLHRRHRSTKFLSFLQRIDAEVPTDLGVHLGRDNSGPRKTPSVHRWLLRHSRFQLHVAPTYSSWINQVERWFGLLTERQLRPGSRPGLRASKDAIRVHPQANNEHPKPCTWARAVDQIFASIARFCVAASEAGH